MRPDPSATSRRRPPTPLSWEAGDAPPLDRRPPASRVARRRRPLLRSGDVCRGRDAVPALGLACVRLLVAVDRGRQRALVEHGRALAPAAAVLPRAGTRLARPRRRGVDRAAALAVLRGDPRPRG